MHLGLLLLFSTVLICGTYCRAFWWNQYATNSESEELQYAWPPRQGKNQKQDDHRKSNPRGGDVPTSPGRADIAQQMPWEQLEAQLAGSPVLRGEQANQMPFDIDSLFNPQPDEGWQWDDPDFKDWDKPTSSDKIKREQKYENNKPKKRQRVYWLAEKPIPRNGLSQERRVLVMESRSWDNPADLFKNDTKSEQVNKKTAKKNKARGKGRKLKAPIRSPNVEKRDVEDSSSLNEGRRRATAHQRKET